MLKKIKENIYYLPHDPKTDRPALGLIWGKDYSLVVDGGNSPKHVRDFLRETEKMNIPPIKYVVITHHHWDHIFGIQEMGAITIAHEKTKEVVDKWKQRSFRDEDLEKMKEEGILSDFSIKCIKAEMPHGENFQIGNIDQVYEDFLEIDLGGTLCNLYHVAGPHTDDSTIIHVPQQKVMFLGDCVYNTGFDGKFAYDRDKLFAMMDKIEKYPGDHYLISHESLWNRKQIVEFWEQLKKTSRIVGENTSLEAVEEKFMQSMRREPTEDERYFLDCFVNWNIVRMK